MKHCFLVVFLLLPVYLFAQPKQGKELVDSLEKALLTVKSDTGKVRLLVKLSGKLYAYDPVKGIRYAQNAFDLARDISWVKGQAMAQVAMGANYEQRSGLSDALTCYFTALKLYENINDKAGIASSCWGIGNIYNVQRNFSKSLQYQFKALESYKTLNDKHGISSLLTNIANNYMMMGQFDTALRYNLEALPLQKELGEVISIATTLTNIGGVYFKKGDYSSALHYYNDVLHIVDKENATMLYARTLANMGAGYLKIALDSIEVTPDSLIPAGYTANLNKGITCLKESIPLSSSIGDIEQLYNTYNDLSEAQESEGDYKNAVASYRKSILYRDSVFSEENKVKMAQMEAERALNLKEKDVQIIRLRSQVYIISIVLLTFIIAIIIVRLLQQRKDNKILSIEKEKHIQHINSQNRILEHIAHIQSHDLRSSVSTILGLSKLFNHENPSDPHNIEIISGISEVANRMDQNITEVINEENKLMRDNKI